MQHAPHDASIRTRRLELVVLTQSFVDAITAGEPDRARRELGGSVSRWLTTDPSHLVQLRLALQAAEAVGYSGFARVIVPATGSTPRVIGSIGFHGPPDDAGRLEVSCRIHPAHRGHGYAAEATTGLLDWATARFGITRFLLAVPSRHARSDLVPIEIEAHRIDTPDVEIDSLADLIEGGRGRHPHGRVTPGRQCCRLTTPRAGGSAGTR
jgi:RimJ/RimL family protein N-acetyltransferase